MKHSLSAEEMQHDIIEVPRAGQAAPAQEMPFWSTCMGREESDCPFYVVGTSPTV